MSWTWLITALTAASLLLSIANTIWNWMSKGGAALAAKLKGQEDKLIEHDRRIQTIEGELRHLPSKDDIAELELKLTTMSGQLNSAERELASVARTARRIEDHLLGAKS